MAGTVTNASAGGSVTHLFLKIPTALVTFVYVDYAFTKLISLILAVDPRRWGHFISLWYNINRRDSEPPTLMLAPSPSHCSISQLSTHLSTMLSESFDVFCTRPTITDDLYNYLVLVLVLVRSLNRQARLNESGEYSTVRVHGYSGRARITATTAKRQPLKRRAPMS
jgi:hypothetical protein